MSKHRRPTDRRRHGLALAATAVAGITLLGASDPALAAKGGGGGKGGTGSSASSLRLVPVDPADPVINQYDDVTFEVSTTATTRPFVGVRCSQAGNLVYDGYVGYFPDYFSDTTWFTMDSPYWADGVAADCDARLFAFDRRGNQDVLATMSFPVAP